LFCLAASLLCCWNLASTTPAVSQSASLAGLSEEGQAALRDQQFDLAQKVYEQVVKLDPRSAEGHSNLGLALYMQVNYATFYS